MAPQRFSVLLEQQDDAAFVQYIATTFDGDQPHLAVDPAASDDGLDGVFCQVNATDPSRIDILGDGVAAVTAWGLMYKEGTTGGNVSLSVFRTGRERINLSAQCAADPGAHEVDGTCGHTFRLKAGDYLTVTQTPTGADNEGNYCAVLITRL